MKICGRCKQSKPPESFSKDRSQPDGRRSVCRVCFRIYSSDGGVKYCNKCGGLKNTRSNKYCAACLVPDEKICTKCKILKPRADFNPRKYPSGRHGLSSDCKACDSVYHQNRRSFPEAKEISRRYCRERYHSNRQFKLIMNLRSRVRSALTSKARKSARTKELLGCPVVWLEVHLESLFKPGMTWENHGPVWHIDHIKPCAAFDLTDPEQQKICFHWTNLQPLFALDNIRKSDKYEN